MKQRFGVRGSVLMVVVLIVGVLPSKSRASTPQRSRNSVTTASQTAQLDLEIKRIVAEINAANVERTVRRLVSFGTRNSLSAQDNPTRGIGAARDYLYDEFTKLVPTSSGRLIVEKQSFVQPVAARIPRPTTLTNVVATLRGRVADSTARTYVVSGHYDSMCGSPTNPDCDAPGANDDASGVAAVLEMARVMSKRSFDATIIFMAVAGEEQGLLGAAYFAEQAKQSNMNIEAMFTNDIIGNSLGGNGVRDRGACACSPKACRQTKRRKKPLCVAASAAKTIRPRVNSLASSKRLVKRMCRE